MSLLISNQFSPTSFDDVHLEKLITEEVIKKNGKDLIESIKNLCGDYAGRIFPYIYRLSLSITQSRRVRSGITFENIIYNIYEILDYPFDSQGDIGSKIFKEIGLGKKVDSVLPGVEQFSQKRTKIIIGTMKTTLRERWQEVAEEITRTNIPQIYLLTADEDISENKAKSMNQHNITIVVYNWIANLPELKEMRNFISFEEYLFNEIPQILDYWEKSDKKN